MNGYNLQNITGRIFKKSIITLKGLAIMTLHELCFLAVNLSGLGSPDVALPLAVHHLPASGLSGFSAGAPRKSKYHRPRLHNQRSVDHSHHAQDIPCVCILI